MTGDITAPERSLHLSGYVDRAFDAVVEVFRGSEIDELMTAALAAATGPAGGEIVLHGQQPEAVSVSTERVVVGWRLEGADGTTSEGMATISLLVVQSGHDPVTEVLLTLSVPDEGATWIAPALRRFLDELTGRLVVAA